MDNYKHDFFQNMLNNLNFEVLVSGYIQADSGWKYYNMSSPYNRLYFVTAGTARIESSTQVIHLTPGNVYLIPANTTNNYICETNMEKYYIHFRIELFSGQDLFDQVQNCLVYPIDSSLGLLLHNKASSRDIGEILHCKAILLNVISGFINTFVQNDPDQIRLASRYSSVFDFIKANCSSKTTVEQIASNINISVSHLSRCFKKDTGETLKSYISRKLIQKSKEHLLLTDLNIKEIAYLLKFRDEFYFSRFFKKHTGMCPREYREKNIMT